jgi:hypothetical protein
MMIMFKARGRARLRAVKAHHAKVLPMARWALIG